MKLEDCSALITGASSGIGREFARQLTPRAKSLVLVARRRDRLEELKTELSARSPSLRVEIREIDLSNLEQTMVLAKSLAEQSIDFLINNAGLGDLGPLVGADPARVNEQVQVNVLALTALTRAVLPQMIAQKRGAILNVSSSAGFLPLPGFAVYAATKAYVTSFSEAIRAETRGCGISVTALCSGPVTTEFTQVADRNHRPRSYGFSVVRVPAEKVARIGLCAIERDKAMVIPGLAMKVGMAITRMTPLSILRLLTPFTRHSE
jgi:short-subunit dehydrogenase